MTVRCVRTESDFYLKLFGVVYFYKMCDFWMGLIMMIFEDKLKLSFFEGRIYFVLILFIDIGHSNSYIYIC